MAEHNINRREALKRMGFLLGSAVSAPVALGILNGLKAESGIAWNPEFFSQEQSETIAIVADIIMPKTDTPASSALGVPKYIEDMVSKVWSELDRKQFMEGFDYFLIRAEDDLRGPFNEASSTMQKAFVNKRHRQIFEGEIDWSKRPFLWSMKELTITGYCTTEVGATELLQYKAIPAFYDGCMPLEEAGGKTWAT